MQDTGKTKISQTSKKAGLFDKSRMCGITLISGTIWTGPLGQISFIGILLFES